MRGRQEFNGFWDRLLAPGIVGLLRMAGGSEVEVNNPASSAARAIGGCMLMRAEVYSRLGGHQAVKHEVCEDNALARLVKRRGYSLGVTWKGRHYG